ncbi:MAG: hypothetical protein SFX18_03560 [Pirellulales bacterium]|nr:hypothetical protein [Pirellulales bacterium]
MPHRSRPYQCRTSRSAFTLVELLLVVALGVILVSLTLPVLFGVASSARLGSAADQLRIAMSTARARAITSGQAHTLTFGPTASQYSVQPLSGFTDSVEANPGTQVFTEQFTLPDGVTYAELASVEDQRSSTAAATAEGANAANQSATGSGNGTNAGTGQQLYFYPDGSTSTAEVQLVNETGLAIKIQLRGLTGTALVSEMYASGNPPAPAATGGNL